MRSYLFFYTRMSVIIFIVFLYIFWSNKKRVNVTSQCSCTSSHPKVFEDTSHMYGWQPIGHTYEEQVRLRNMSSIIAFRSKTIKDNIPTVPCLSADGHLLVLSVAASRIRYGVSLTFIMVLARDIKIALPKQHSSEPISPHQLSLWCIFDDGSITPVYSHNVHYGNDRASLLDCPLSSFAIDQLWKYNKTLRVHLASTTDQKRDLPILKAFIHVPKPIITSLNSSHELLTLCTSPLHNKDKYLAQWIEFHRLVGFRKFVIYNTTDTDHRLSSILNIYSRKYPNLIDVVQWNFSSLALNDVLSGRYFQVEALHDCLIRYGDQSEWLGMIDLDEYIVPLHPYETVLDYLHEKYGRRILGSINLWSQFFCSRKSHRYTMQENDTNRLTIERFILRAPTLYKIGREKYLYRPRFVQYLSIHHQIEGLVKEQPSENDITFAHYVSMSEPRTFPGCSSDKYVNDTRIRDRFAGRVKNALKVLFDKM